MSKQKKELTEVEKQFIYDTHYGYKEKKLAELNDMVKKDILEGKNEIVWILKTIMFLGLISIFLVLIFGIFR